LSIPRLSVRQLLMAHSGATTPAIEEWLAETRDEWYAAVSDPRWAVYGHDPWMDEVQKSVPLTREEAEYIHFALLARHLKDRDYLPASVRWMDPRHCETLDDAVRYISLECLKRGYVNISQFADYFLGETE
jgi:hypothetical protein